MDGVGKEGQRRKLVKEECQMCQGRQISNDMARHETGGEGGCLSDTCVDLQT